MVCPSNGPDRTAWHSGRVVHLDKVSPSEGPGSSWQAGRRDVGTRWCWFKSLRQRQAAPIMVEDVEEEDEEEEDDSMLNQHIQNLKDPKTKVLPSTTRGGKELPSSSALDSPSVMKMLCTSLCPTIARDVMPDTALPDTTRDAMLDTARDAIMPDDAMLDTARDTSLPDVPVGVFLDAHIARVTSNARDASETADTIEIEPAFAPARSSSPRYELPDIPEGYIMEGEIAEDFLACHPKRIDQDSQGINANTASHPKEKKKDDRNLHAGSPNTVTPEEPNDISASDAETQSGDEHEPGDNMDSDVHNNAQPSNDEDVEIEPTVNPDNPQPKRYDKNDFTARKHDFVILDIPEDNAMAVILGRLFLNTAGAVIDCNKGNVTFHVNGNEHTMHFPKKRYQVHCINAIENTSSILIGSFECPIPRVKMKYDLLVGEIHIPIEVT
ncbi:hypothetical protein ZWY2020_029951 [Hordeum vulgare]|nr:hypothetical protein ZWY2020_029951 [Hordeum vulgare]